LGAEYGGVDWTGLPNYVYIRATGSNITWSLEGELPPGLEFYYGQIYGIPTDIGKFPFKVIVKNVAGSDTADFIIVIEELLPPVIITEPLPNGKVGTSYEHWISFLFSSNNSNNIFTWSSSGELPPGLEFGVLQGFDGAIFGTPTDAGEFPFKIIATNAAGSDTAEFTIVIEELLPPVITTESLPNGEVGTNYYQYINTTDYNIVWSLEDDLPPGLSLSDYGYISGIPTEAGGFSFRVIATNTAGSDTTEFTIVIEEPQPPVIITTTLPKGKVGTNYYQYINTTGYNIAWSLEDDLPPGLSLFDYGYISGIPKRTGEFTFKVIAKNTIGSDTTEFTIVIGFDELQPPVITTETLPNSEVGSDYSEQIEATGSDIVWSISGELPPGLEFDDGNIQGTPTKAGTYTFTVKAENADGSSAKQFIVTIARKLVTIGITVADKEYDGTAIATIVGTPTITGLIEGDDVTVVIGTALFADEEIGTGKTVTFSGFSLAGDDAGNYTLSGQPASVTADITEPTYILPQIAAGNRLALAQTHSGINLTVTTGATIDVYNLSGKLMSSQNYLAGNHSISFGHLPKGMYIVKASFGSEKQILRVPIK